MHCPQCGLINPDIAQRCDCGYDFIRQEGGKSDSVVRPNGKASRAAVGAQVVALVLTGAAVIWGCLMIHVAFDPGPSGEFGGYSVLFATVVDLPVGLLSLLVGIGVKRGHPVLRWVTIALSVAALALPFLTRVAWQSQFIRVK